MRSRLSEAIVISAEAAVAHAVQLSVGEEPIEWCPNVSSALRAISPSSTVLVFDSAVDGPLSRLLPTLFVDREPGRRAIVLQREGISVASFDPRVVVLSWPPSLETLANAIAGESMSTELAIPEQLAAMELATAAA